MSEILKNMMPEIIENNIQGKKIEIIFEELLNGKANEAQIGAILIAMKIRGESVEEITAGVKVLRNNCIKVKTSTNAIDIVGTGGDGKGTLNISTAASFVVAGAGMPVAKHGNRNLSSLSGSADVLEILGLKLNLSPKKISESIQKAGIGFMMAPNHHPTIKNVMSARKTLGVRTIFNILGPLANPAEVKYQLTGCYDEKLLKPMIETLKKLGCKNAWLVHGEDGTDEVSISGSTKIIELKNGKLKKFLLKPTDVGLKTFPIEMIKGKDPKYNALAIENLLKGEHSAYREAVLLNAASALYISEKAISITEGIKMSKQSIDSGRALNCLKIASKI